MATTNFGWITPSLSGANNPPADLASLGVQVDGDLHTVATPPLLRIYASATSLATSGVAKTVTCTEEFNLGPFGPGAGSWARTVPVAGYYRIAAQIRWGFAPSGYGRTQIFAGGTIVGIAEGPLHSSLWTTPLAEYTGLLAAGTEAYFSGVQNSGGTVDIVGGSVWHSWMSIELLRRV